MKQNNFFRYNDVRLIVLLILTLSSCRYTDPDALQISNLEHQIENRLVLNFEFKGEEAKTYTLEERMAELKIPGVSIAVAKNGELIWSKAYGFADLEENRPMTTETMFLTCSVSKIIAAARVLQLVEEGKIKLDEDVNTYLSSWKVPENEFTLQEKVTIKRLLEHRAGLNGRGGTAFYSYETIPTTLELLDGINTKTAPVQVVSVPGSKYEYSANDYLILEQMIEDIDGISFRASIEQNIFTPLRMERSTFENPFPFHSEPDAASAYTEDGIRVPGKYKIPADQAAAGMWSTPSDLLKYITEIQTTLQNQMDGFLSYETVSQMRLNQDNVGHLGLFGEKYAFGHPGGCTGFNAVVLAWNEQPYALAITVNGDDPNLKDEIIYAISEVLNLPKNKEPRIYEVYPMSMDQLEGYSGNYKILEEGLGDNIQLKINGGKLQYDFIKVKEPVVLTPISDSIFVDNRGYRHLFKLNADGKADKYFGWGFMESIKSN